MNGKRRFRLITAIFLLLLCSTAFGQLISVVIQPESDVEKVRIYPYEVATYKIFIVNIGSETEENINLVARVDEELAIIVEKTEVREKRFVINRLLPNREPEIREIRVKALQSAKKDLRIFVDYGVGDGLIHTYSTSLTVIENPIIINARLSRTAMNADEQGSVLLDMANSSSFVLYDINAELDVSEGLQLISEPYYVESLDPNQSFSNKEFKFIAEPGISGERNLVLKLSYTDREGRHTIEKNFVVDVQNRLAYIFILVAGVILLVVLSYLLRQKGKKQKIDTAIKVEEIPPPAESSNQQ